MQLIMDNTCSKAHGDYVFLARNHCKRQLILISFTFEYPSFSGYTDTSPMLLQDLELYRQVE